MVAMSGGVDSSVAALMLKDAGFNPVGVTLRYWVDPLSEERAAGEHRGCCSLEAVTDARRVAQALDIPHYVMNMKDEFYHNVVSYFVEEYIKGRTPNPCIACNRFMKFSVLLERALALDINFLATGHYARIQYDPEKSIYRLLRGRDREKDQSYMLYVLEQEQMPHVIFPLGGLTKKEVREIALDRGLKVADKRESQEICFVPDNDYRGFLNRESPDSLKPGDIISTRGEKLGEHSGIANYTIGQRRGLGITSSRPLYVVDIIPEKNTIVVGQQEELYSSGLISETNNFVAGYPPDTPLQVEVKIRYRSPLVPATIDLIGEDKVKVVFEEKQKAVTPGQAVVFYKGEEVLGGGIITTHIK